MKDWIIVIATHLFVQALLFWFATGIAYLHYREINNAMACAGCALVLSLAIMRLYSNAKSAVEERRNNL